MSLLNNEGADGTIPAPRQGLTMSTKTKGPSLLELLQERVAKDGAKAHSLAYIVDELVDEGYLSQTRALLDNLRQQEQPDLQPLVLHLSSLLAAEAGELDEASRFLNLSSQRFQAKGDRASQAAVSLWAIRLKRQIGDFTEASKLIRQFDEELLKAGGETITAHFKCERAALFAARGARHAAFETLRDGLECAKRGRDRIAQVRIGTRLAVICASRGDTGRARAYVEASEKLLGEPLSAKLEVDWLVNRAIALRACFDGEGAEAALASAIEIANKEGLKGRLANAVSELGSLVYRQGELDRAENLFSQAIKFEGELGRKVAEAELHFRLSTVERARGHLKEASAALQKAETTFKEANHPNGVSRCLFAKAGIAHTNGSGDEALAKLADCLAIRRETGDCLGAAQVLGEQATVYRDRGELASALELYTHSLEIRREAGDRYGVAVVLNDLAMVYRFRGDYPQALDLYRESLVTKEAMGDRYGMALTLNELALALKDQGSYNEAFETVERGIELAHAVNARLLLIRLRNNKAHLMASFGDLESATELLETNLTEIQHLGCRLEEPKTLGAMAEIYRIRCCTGEAIEAVRRCEALAEDSGDKRALAFSLLQRAQLEADRGGYFVALEGLKKCHELREQLQEVRGIAEVLWREGAIHEALENWTAAAEAYEQALTVATSYSFPQPALLARLGITGLAAFSGKEVELSPRKGEAFIYDVEELLSEADDLEYVEALFWAFRLLGRLHESVGEGAAALRYYGRAIEMLEAGAWGGGRQAAESLFNSRCTSHLAHMEESLKSLLQAKEAPTKERSAAEKSEEQTLLCMRFEGLPQETVRKRVMALLEVDRIAVPRILNNRGEVLLQQGPVFFALFDEEKMAGQTATEIWQHLSGTQDEHPMALRSGKITLPRVDEAVMPADEYFKVAHEAMEREKVLSEAP